MRKQQPEYSKAATVRRRDAAIARALNTPPKPHKPLKATTSPVKRNAIEKGATAKRQKRS